MDVAHELPLFPTISPSDRFLIVVPHPDDESLGAAGLIQRVRSVGATLRIIVATDGNKRGKGRRRATELRAALATCGLSDEALTCYDFRDGGLAAHKEIVFANLEKELSSFQPTHVIVTDPLDIHADHAVLGQIMQEFQSTGRYLGELYTILIHYHRFPRPLGGHPTIFLLPPARLLRRGRWCQLVLSKLEQEVKWKAIRQHRSQFKTPLLRGLLFSFNRRNELYCQLYPHQEKSS